MFVNNILLVILYKNKNCNKSTTTTAKLALELGQLKK